MDEEGVIQGVLDFDSGNSNGYENWIRNREAYYDLIREKWSLPVGRTVRVRLFNIDGEFEGKLQLVSQPDRIDGKGILHLRVNSVDFFNSDIEQCIVFD